VLLIIATVVNSCKKDKKATECFSESPTIREISNKQAVVRLSATFDPVWIIEQGTIDTRLIPCNFPMEFYQDGLEVVISGKVKSPPNRTGPCCAENFVITKIARSQ
jgi:hypothetical protein